MFGTNQPAVVTVDAGIIYFESWLHSVIIIQNRAKMHNLKIYKRSPVMLNTALFTLFTIFFIHVVESFVAGVSTFRLDSLGDFVRSHGLLFSTFFIFSISLFRGKRYSKYIYFIFIAQSILIIFQQYLIELDKFVLIVNFLFAILSYYFYLFMSADLSVASNTPVFKSGDLYRGLTLGGVVNMLSGDIELQGEFINWDDSTCFLKVNGNTSKVRRDVAISWIFEGVEYAAEGVIVAGVENLGIGVLISETKGSDSRFGWEEFYDIIRTRGYSPYLMA